MGMEKEGNKAISLVMRSQIVIRIPSTLTEEK